MYFDIILISYCLLGKHSLYTDYLFICKYHKLHCKHCNCVHLGYHLTSILDLGNTSAVVALAADDKNEGTESVANKYTGTMASSSDERRAPVAIQLYGDSESMSLDGTDEDNGSPQDGKDTDSGSFGDEYDAHSGSGPLSPINETKGDEMNQP